MARRRRAINVDADASAGAASLAAQGPGSRTGLWASRRRLRYLIGATLLLIVAIDLGAKASVERFLVDGRPRDLGLIDLQLTYNPGAAFSLGAELPTEVVLAVTTVIAIVVAVFAWRSAAAVLKLRALALTAVLAGAVANIVDRAGDGVVTDYLHTTWWPTFNLADVSITLGAVALACSALRGEEDHRSPQQ